jgi:hypothetical protein
MMDDLFETTIENLTEKNALLVSAADHLQVGYLKAFIISYSHISCHFVKQAFVPQFKYLYFYNQKAEEFKWLTAKFLNHGLFDFWKGLESRMFNVFVRTEEKRLKRSNNNSSSTETLDFNNFIGQVHFPLFYTVVSMLTGIFVFVFLSECAIENAPELSLFVHKKIKQWGINCVDSCPVSIFGEQICQSPSPYS